jgi:hypothetical protein
MRTYEKKPSLFNFSSNNIYHLSIFAECMRIYAPRLILIIYNSIPNKVNVHCNIYVACYLETRKKISK